MAEIDIDNDTIETLMDGQQGMEGHLASLQKMEGSLSSQKESVAWRAKNTSSSLTGNNNANKMAMKISSDDKKPGYKVNHPAFKGLTAKAGDSTIAKIRATVALAKAKLQEKLFQVRKTIDNPFEGNLDRAVDAAEKKGNDRAEFFLDRVALEKAQNNKKAQQYLTNNRIA